ncbi:MAG TPA: sugar ABC transporter substrate-binding protein [Burkholderiales bacterium]|nr:sugar ABC transporter substrate-binding protein [Burkholderiales bacterium]
MEEMRTVSGWSAAKIRSPFLIALSFCAAVWPAVGAAQSAAERAVEAAKKYAGTTLTVEWQAGLQALDPINFSGPLWQNLTGIKVRVVEVPLAEVFSKIMLEYRSGTGAFDVVDVVPSWMPDLAQAGALAPLDAWVDRYGYRDELQKIAPTFRDNWTTANGSIYALPDDGDVLILYYRKDLFAEPETRTAFRSRFGYDLAPPRTWKQFDDIGSFLTERLKPSGVYGACAVRDPAFAQYMFQERFRNEGGRFFDSDTMQATINSPVGAKVLAEMRAENRFMPPGVEKFNFTENLAVFQNGNCAMTISWPPVGRWTAGYGTDDKALAFVPKSKVAGKVGYALPPGGHPELAIGHALSVSSNSRNKDAAYLFIQWLNSEEISIKRVQLPYTLRDPFRTSHYANPEYLARWPDAKFYLATLKAASETGLFDLSLIQTDKYEEVLRMGFSRLWAGEDPKSILDDLARQWDELTARVGVQRQKAAYLAWAAKPGAYPR